MLLPVNGHAFSHLFPFTLSHYHANKFKAKFNRSTSSSARYAVLVGNNSFPDMFAIDQLIYKRG